MSAQTLYSGPGKLFFNGVGFQADGENGQINCTLDEKTTQRGTAMFGRLLETLDDQIVKIAMTPFDSWGILGALFPTILGVTTTAGAVTNGAGTGLLAVGTRPHDFAAGSVNGLAAAKIFTSDGRLYNWVRAAMTKHPEMKLGVGQTLFGGAELTCLGDPGANPGSSGFILAGNAITETAATDPDSTGFALTDFVNGAWVGAWGAVTGFTAMQAEDYWTLVTDVKYSPLTVQKITRHMKLDSAAFMIKARIAGPTHTQIVGKILAHTSGQILKETSAVDLVLTGPASKTITLKGCEIKGAGFEFGGTRLGTGEVGFVTETAFASGVPAPTLLFSA